MDENLNGFNESQEGVVVSQEQAEVTDEVTESETVAEEGGEVVAPQQTPEQNSQYAAARRESEAKLRETEAQNNRLIEALKVFGIEGNPEEIADMLLAQAQNIPLEDAKAQREAKEQADLQHTQAQAETEFYRSIAIQKLMADDLKTIQSVYPDVKDLKGLGNEFFSLLGATKDPLLAYEAMQLKKAKTAKAIPPDIGAINEVSTKEKDFYSSAEVDKLTSTDYDKNPKLMDIVRKSMSKW